MARLKGACQEENYLPVDNALWGLVLSTGDGAGRGKNCADGLAFGPWKNYGNSRSFGARWRMRRVMAWSC